MVQMPLPPAPPSRDADLRLSEVIPFRSSKIRIWGSRALLPVIVVAGATVALFGFSFKTYADIRLYMNVVAAVILLLTFLVLYIYAGERKNILWYAFPAFVTALQLEYLIGPYIHVFREILPGNTDAKGFGPAFVGMFFGAGLMEEMLKGVPILFGLAVALLIRAYPSASNLVTRGLAVQGPLDGLLMGAAAGAAFIMIETMTMYVPSTIGKVQDASLGHLMGFVLMIPRVMKSVVGHMGYAGIFGYFIGLAATHPRSAWKLVLFGLLVSSVLHAFWNSAGELSRDYGPYVSAALIGFTFFACLLKARQLEASRVGGYIDGRSILALSPEVAPAPVVPGGIVPPAPSGVAGAFTGAATALERTIGVTAHTTPVAAAPAAPVPESGVAIGTPDLRYALVPGLPIDLSALFGGVGAPPGYQGAILAGADGSLALVNTGPAAWSVVRPDGSRTTVPSGAYLEVRPGTSLLVGGATLAIAAY